MNMPDKHNGQKTPEQPTAPESFENVSHQILRNPIQVDLSQPDRADAGDMETVTGFKESKLIAEIITPTDHLGVIHTKLARLDPVIMIVGSKSHEARMTLEPNEELDVSDINSRGKCIISLDKSGRLLVHATNPDPAYRISTKELEQYQDAQSAD